MVEISSQITLFCRFEGGGHLGSGNGIEGFPTLVDMSDTFSIQTTLFWFDSLLAALDCYTWVFGENLLTPGELFGSKLSGKYKKLVHL